MLKWSILHQHWINNVPTKMKRCYNYKSCYCCYCKLLRPVRLFLFFTMMHLSVISMSCDSYDWQIIQCLSEKLYQNKYGGSMQSPQIVALLSLFFEGLLSYLPLRRNLQSHLCLRNKSRKHTDSFPIFLHSQYYFRDTLWHGRSSFLPYECCRVNR